MATRSNSGSHCLKNKKAVVIGMIDVTALARPDAGCMGYAASGHAYIGGAGAIATVTLLLESADICQTIGAGGSVGCGSPGFVSCDYGLEMVLRSGWHGENSLELTPLGANLRQRTCA